MERLKQEIYDVVRRASLSIPAAVWYTVTPQLVSRAAHPNPSLMRGVSELLAIILHAHPDEAVWAVTGLTQSLNPDRKKVGSELFSLAVKRLQKADARDAALERELDPVRRAVERRRRRRIGLVRCGISARGQRLPARLSAHRRGTVWRVHAADQWQLLQLRRSAPNRRAPVSYTHLTLPTKA